MENEERKITYIFLNDRDMENYQQIKEERLETDSEQIYEAINELNLKIQELQSIIDAKK